MPIALPPLVELTHHPRRVEQLTETAEVGIPAFGDTVTETFTVPAKDGTVTEHTEVAGDEATLSYTIPMPAGGVTSERTPVLDFVQSGGRYWTRSRT